MFDRMNSVLYPTFDFGTTVCEGSVCPDNIVGPPGMVGVCVAWDSASSARGLQSCSPDGKICSKMAVRKEHIMSASTGIFLNKRVVCSDDGECSVIKMGQCFDVGEKVFKNCHFGGGNSWAGECMFRMIDDYGPAELEQDTIAFAKLVLHQMKHVEGWPRPCSNVSVNQVQTIFKTNDHKVARGAIANF